MANTKIPEELRKAHWRHYMAQYRQRQKQKSLKEVISYKKTPNPPTPEERNAVSIE